MRQNSGLLSSVTGMVLLGMSLAIQSAPTHADALKLDGLYVGLGAGRVDSGGSSDSLSEAGTNIRLGYEFSNMLSAELGYLERIANEEDFDTDTWSASVVLSFPLTAVDLYGKLGAMYQDDSGDVRLGLTSQSSDSTRGFAALGAEIRMGLYNLYGEYTRVDSDEADGVDIFSAGFKIRF